MRGSSLIEVLLALGIVATLAVASTQIQLGQRRLQAALAERLIASAVLDAWAEQRQMHVFSANVGGADTARSRIQEAIAADAAIRLTDGRAEVREVSNEWVELQIHWRSQCAAAKRHAYSLRGGDSVCESILVAVHP